MVSQTYEGQWEEIAREHGRQLAGQRVRLTVLEASATEKRVPPGTPLAEAMKEYIGMFKSDRPDNQSERVDEVFGDIVEQEHRRSQEPRE
jgi:hypothetical protein